MWKFGQKDAARQTFLKVLETDHDNRAALTSLGFLSREMGNPQEAEQIFPPRSQVVSQGFVFTSCLGRFVFLRAHFR